MSPLGRHDAVPGWSLFCDYRSLFAFGDPTKYRRLASIAKALASRTFLSVRGYLSLSQTQSDYQSIENRAMLLRDERSCQAHYLDGR